MWASISVCFDSNGEIRLRWKLLFGLGDTRGLVHRILSGQKLRNFIAINR